MLIERLYIKELRKYLNRTDKRTLVNWCNNNSVGVLRDMGSSDDYVLKEEFERAYNRAPKNFYSKKYDTSEIPQETIKKRKSRVYNETPSNLSIGKNPSGFLNELLQMVNQLQIKLE